MNTQELIEKYEDKLKDIQLKFGANFKTKVYEGLVEDLRQLYEPQKSKYHSLWRTGMKSIKIILSIIFGIG